MTAEQQLAVVRLCRECQTWWLMERVARESVEEASRDLDRAASLAQLAVEIAARVRGPEGWCRRVRGYAAAHPPNVLRVAGELKAARAGLELAKQEWNAGQDPGRVLDPGRLLDLEASLCRAERDFDKALVLLDEAIPVSHSPGRILVKKGFTLEVMGDHDRAYETLFQAVPVVERQGDPRLLYMARFNLAVACTDRGDFAAANDLVSEVRDLASERGDENELTRILWLEGRLAIGLGRPLEARVLLEQARREFAAREMWYDVALAQLEMTPLLLEEGRLGEVKELAAELVEIFDSKGIHREALAALRLFSEAADREVATVELARSILRYLVRARDDQGLRFNDSTALGTAIGIHSTTLIAQGLRGGAAIRIHDAAFITHGLGAGAAAGVHTTSRLGKRPAPEGGEEGPELLQQAGAAGRGSQQGGGEGGGEERLTHRMISRAAPAAGLRGPRGPRLPRMVRSTGGKFPGPNAVEPRLTWKQRLARLFRALSGLTQSEFGEHTGVDPILIDRHEQGKSEPKLDTLRHEAQGIGLTVQEGEEILRYADTLRRPRRRAGLGRAELFWELAGLGSRVHERLLRLPLAGRPPRAENRERAEELWALLKDFPEDQQLAVVRVGWDFQNQALAELFWKESKTQASRDPARAASLARLAQEIVERAPGP